MSITIPHQAQRYPTVGDYIDGHGVTLFLISNLSDRRYEALVLVHEIIEKILCDARGVTNEAIDKFDMDFEAARQDGDDREPGHEPDAPYHREHVFAESIERQLAVELGVDWESYDKEVREL